MEDILDEKHPAHPPAMEIDERVPVDDREPIHLPLAIRWLNDGRHPDEAFATKNIPDLGHEVADFQVFSWKLSKWRTLDKKMTSPSFSCGGHKWYAGLCSAHCTTHQPFDRFSGASSYSRQGTQMHLQMKQFRFT